MDSVFIVQAHHKEFDLCVTRVFALKPSDEMLEHLHPGADFGEWDVIGEVTIEKIEDAADG